ncbi:coiled-coil domain-containing protein 65-like protein [Polychytrium aggregatum]|uniref:coiled-coil domain-containing protein 65-like protein n=1 Tax=Polychytrium aggregatum TaxID=110093 RepID=UPI0022FE997B|nr:coiled-coil domain-containing protein 65-like protein [Polychytrium aggregatum]KAI9205758.1 coiled-coil domain-containing protein 65-like protein [Polychytrium aggregatum]
MAKKGKKGKKGGEAKTEAQLLKEEEQRKRVMEVIKEKAKERQALEEKNAKINMLKINNMWREIMKIAKTREMSHQTQVLKSVHERQVDRKTVGILNLGQSLFEAEEQFETALKAHCINVDTLIDLQRSRLDFLMSQFESDLGTLDTEFNSERYARFGRSLGSDMRLGSHWGTRALGGRGGTRLITYRIGRARIQMQHAKDKADLVGIMTRMDQEFQETEGDAKHEYSSLKDDIKNKNLEEKHSLRIQLEGTVEDLWKQFQAALNQYNTGTEERKKQFEELKQKDQKNAKEIEQQMKKLVKLQETIAGLKTKLSNNAREFEQQNKILREEKELIQGRFQALKRRMNSFRDDERKKLTDLTITSNRVLKDLQEKVQKAEKIIKLAEMNRKLEVEEEKIVPFYKDSIEGTRYEAMDISAESGIKLPKEFEAMEQFHKRFNKVHLDKLGLEKQHKTLQEENAHLRSILKQYLDGISVTETVLSQLNPLIVVNGRTNAPLDHPQSQMNLTYVEARHQLEAQKMNAVGDVVPHRSWTSFVP